jgi:nucleotide-binding universal stress UspA family protein
MLPTIRHILYATDLGEHSRQVLRYALSLARQYEATITVLHVLEPLSNFGAALVEVYLPRENAEKLHADAVREVYARMRQKVEEFCQAELHLTSEQSHWIAAIEIAEGATAPAIVAQAQASQADMIVMGTHSHATLGQWLSGSTARRVAQMSPIPVLVVPVERE